MEGPETRGFLMLRLIEGDDEGHDLPGDDCPGRHFGLWTAAGLPDALGGASSSTSRSSAFQGRMGYGNLLATAKAVPAVAH